MKTFNAQEYFEKNLNQERVIIIDRDALKLSKEKLEGDLTIKDCPNLMEIDLNNQQLTALTVINCPLLSLINVRNNQLTSLNLEKVKIDESENPTNNGISEIFAGDNQLTELNLTYCSNLGAIIIPDNPYLTKLEKLNLASLKSINIANTQISLNEKIAELKGENERLIKALSKVNEVRITKELKWVEPIQTAKQAEEAIQRHLKVIESKWRAYFESSTPEETKQQNPLLALSFENPKLAWKAKAVLAKVVEAITNRNYSELINFWNEGEKFNPQYEFDGSLEELMRLWNGYQFLLTREQKITTHESK